VIYFSPYITGFEPDSSVGMKTTHCVAGWEILGSISLRPKICVVAAIFWSDVGPAQPPSQVILVALCTEVKRPEHNSRQLNSVYCQSYIDWSCTFYSLYAVSRLVLTFTSVVTF